MHSTAAARRYARALFSLAGEEARVAEVRDELAALGRVFNENADLQHAIFRPLHPAAERRAVLGAVGASLGSSRTVTNFLRLLVDRRRLIDFDAICQEYCRLADVAAGRILAEVVSATPLREEQRERLRHALAARTGKQVELASQTLKRQVTAADQDRLLDEFVQTIERAPTAGGARPQSAR